MIPFVRVTRDKRGYEQIALMHASPRSRRSAAPRTLYVFRTPPGVKVGREPFDESIRRMIEEQNPGVFFDWKRLSRIEPPPPDVEYWREKRRAEKAAKQARREEEREEAAQGSSAEARATALTPASGETTATEVEAAPIAPRDAEEPEETAAGDGRAEGTAAEALRPEGQTGPPAEASRRRRRRRGGRGRRKHPQTDQVAGGPAGPPNIAADPSKER